MLFTEYPVGSGLLPIEAVNPPLLAPAQPVWQYAAPSLTESVTPDHPTSPPPAK